MGTFVEFWLVSKLFNELFKYFKYNNFSTPLAFICLLGEANGGAAGGVLPDVAVGAADHGLAAGAQAIPALDLNYVDSK